MRILSVDHSLLHAQVRAKALRRLLKSHLKGDLSKLPSKTQIDAEATIEADDAVLFEIRKEIFEEALEDFPVPVVRTVHDILGPDPSDPFIPEVTWEAGLLEKEVHDEVEAIIKESVKALAEKVAKNNISFLRVEMQKAIRNMAASGDDYSEGIDLQTPTELERLMRFNKPMTKKIFEPAMGAILDKQWADFSFDVRIYMWGYRSGITLSVNFRVKPNYKRRQIPSKPKPKKRKLSKKIAKLDANPKPRKKRKKNNTWMFKG